MSDEPSTDVVVVDVVPLAAISLDDSEARFEAFKAFVRGQMIEDVDVGTIPGTPRPTLFKPGAEKLCNFFGFTVEQPPDLIQRLEEWDREPPRFAYEVHTIIRNKRTSLVESTGLGACNSMETRYRWRKGGADCPECGKVLRQSRDERREWYCWRKEDGCGATFPEERFTAARVENTETADLQNTILKMAAKRSMVDAVLRATRGSGLFTQDMEDAPAAPAEAREAKQEPEAPRPPQPRPSRATDPPARPAAASAATERPANGSANVKPPPDEIKTLSDLFQFAAFHHGWQPAQVASFCDVTVVGEIATKMSTENTTYEEVANAITVYHETQAAEAAAEEVPSEEGDDENAPTGEDVPDDNED